MAFCDDKRSDATRGVSSLSEDTLVALALVFKSSLARLPAVAEQSPSVETLPHVWRCLSRKELVERQMSFILAIKG